STIAANAAILATEAPEPTEQSVGASVESVPEAEAVVAVAAENSTSNNASAAPVAPVTETKRSKTPGREEKPKKQHASKSQSPSRVPVPVKSGLKLPMPAPVTRQPSAKHNNAVARTDSGLAKPLQTPAKPASVAAAPKPKSASTPAAKKTIPAAVKSVLKQKPDVATAATSKPAQKDFLKKRVPSLKATTSSASLEKTDAVKGGDAASGSTELAKPLSIAEMKKKAVATVPSARVAASASSKVASTKPVISVAAPSVKPKVSFSRPQQQQTILSENALLKKENSELKKKIEDLSSALASMKMHDSAPPVVTQTYMPVPSEITPLLHSHQGTDNEEDDDDNEIKEEVEVESAPPLPPALTVEEEKYDADFEVDEGDEIRINASNAKTLTMNAESNNLVNEKVDEMVVDQSEQVSVAPMTDKKRGG
ncbi:hypothetical protein HDU99_006655, partial [Rhizoclosmatium hyalinum]